MAVALLLIILAASFVVVRLGAVAFELTGLPWEQAKFQALSAYTNSGFTTRESEDVVSHPVRRRIASYLIIAGNAGLVTTVASLAGSLVTPYWLGSVRNLAIIVVGASVIVILARRPGLSQRLRTLIRRWLGRRFQLEVVPNPSELLRLDEGYSLSRVELRPGSRAVERSLAELGLKDKTLQVLAIERGEAFIPVPDGKDRLLAGDQLIVYGARSSVQKTFDADSTQSLSLVAAEHAIGSPEPESTSDQV